MCEEQRMHDEMVWNIKHGLVHHSFAAIIMHCSQHHFWGASGMIYITNTPKLRKGVGKRD
jgi:hypothetical protein